MSPSLEALEAAAVGWLRLRIETLSSVPPCHAFSALTPRNVPFVALHNGAISPEGSERPPLTYGGLCDAVERAIDTARTLRAAIPGDAVLFWRCLPVLEAVDDGRRLYTRFAFEAL